MVHFIISRPDGMEFFQFTDDYPNPECRTVKHWGLQPTNPTADFNIFENVYYLGYTGPAGDVWGRFTWK